MTGKARKRLHVYYKALPERCYTEQQIHVVTPENLQDAVNISWDFQEYFSGSSAVTALCAQSSWNTLFPVDYRYGRDIGLAEHRELLDIVDAKFTPKVILFSLDFSNWNGGS